MSEQIAVGVQLTNRQCAALVGLLRQRAGTVQLHQVREPGPVTVLERHRDRERAWSIDVDGLCSVRYPAAAVAPWP